MNRVFFVTAVGGDIGSSVVKHMRENYPDDEIIGCDTQRYNQGLEYTDQFFVAPSYNEEKGYLSFVKDICDKYKITHMLPMTETEIKIIDKNRPDFEQRNIKLLLNDHVFIEIMFSKYQSMKYLKKHSFDIPQTWKADEEFEHKFPLIVKADCSCGSKNVKVVKDEYEFAKTLSEIPDPVIQEYIGTDDEEYTMAIFSNGKKTESIVFRRKLGYGGMSVFVELVENTALAEMAVRISNCLHLSGSINVQMRRKGDKFFIFEINPRISSTIGFRYKLGFRDDIWWINLLDGESCDINYLQIRGPAVGVKLLGEKIIYPEPDRGGGGYV